jgi:hypothetical protein
MEDVTVSYGSFVQEARLVVIAVRSRLATLIVTAVRDRLAIHGVAADSILTEEQKRII